MSNKVHKKGNFNDSLNTQILGSIYVAESNSIDIHVNTSQNTETYPLPTFVLNIYENKEPYSIVSGSDNINEMFLKDSIKLECSGSSNNNDFNYNIKIDSQYLIFSISNPDLNDLHYNFKAVSSNKPLDNYLYRDEKLELNEPTLCVRNISHFKTEAMSGLHRGITAWNMNAKGDLTNSEYLLNDGNIINSLGYFDSSLEQHKANTIIIKSDNSNDNISGLGGQKIKITGLNNTYNLIDETIELNGLSEVSSTNQFTEVNYASIIQSGSLYCNAGNILIYNGDVNGGTSTNPQNSIIMDCGSHSNPQYGVPQGYELHIQKVFIHSHCEDECQLMLNKYQWIGPTSPPNNINKNRLRTYHIHGNTSIESDVNFVLHEQERFTITSKTNILPTGTNKISINVSGYLKLRLLTKSSKRHRDLGINYVEGFDFLPVPLPTSY